MLGTHSLGVFAATVLVVNATPGVDMMFALTQTLRRGVAAGMAAAGGALAGCVVHTLVAAFGLAALLAASATAFTLVKGAGAAYLLWLAFAMLRASAASAGAGARRSATGASPAVGETRPGLLRVFGQGMLTNVLNPKIALFFLALLPQFIDAGAPAKLLAFLFLGTWFVVQSAFFLAAFVLLVAPLRRWRASPAWQRGLNATGAAIFVWLAARLAFVDRT